MAKETKDTHGVGTDRGGGAKSMKKEGGAGGKGAANKRSASEGRAKARAGK